MAAPFNKFAIAQDWRYRSARRFVLELESMLVRIVAMLSTT